MKHEELSRLLERLDWSKQVHPSGTIDYYLNNGPIDRMVRMIPEDPAHAMCADRGGERVVTSLEEAAEWARKAVQSGDGILKDA